MNKLLKVLLLVRLILNSRITNINLIGIFQMMIAGKETKEHLIEVLNMLKAAVSNDPQVIKIIISFI